jgi:hypothetical protein
MSEANYNLFSVLHLLRIRHVGVVQNNSRDYRQYPDIHIMCSIMIGDEVRISQITNKYFPEVFLMPYA